MKIHIGVYDVPYPLNSNGEKIPKAKKGKSNKPLRTSEPKTTGEVAEILEQKYAVMQSFVDNKSSQIAEVFEESISNAIESMILGAPLGLNPMSAATSELAQMYKDFISTGEAESAGINGVPTQAALDGVNHRLAHPNKKGNPRRPSFIDTSLYVNSVVSWADEF